MLLSDVIKLHDHNAALHKPKKLFTDLPSDLTALSTFLRTTLPAAGKGSSDWRNCWVCVSSTSSPFVTRFALLGP
jgi:hypothetical protein